MSIYLTHAYLLIIAIIVLFLGNYVYSIDRSDKINKIFLFFSTLISYLALTQYYVITAETDADAMFWRQLNVVWPFVFTTVFHLTLLMTKRRKLLTNKLLIFLAYLIAGIVSIIELYLIRVKGVFLSKGNMGGFEVVAIISYGILYLISFILSLFYFRQQHDNLDRRKAGWIVSGHLIFLVIILLCFSVSSFFDLDCIIVLVIGFSLMSLSMAYSIHKFDKLKLTPSRVADDIFSSISDILIIVDDEGKILNVNQAAVEMLGFDRKEIEGSNFVDYLVGNGKQIGDLFQKDSQENVRLKIKTKGNSFFPAFVSVSIMKDKRDNIIGYVISCRDVTERDKIYKKLEDKKAELEKKEKSLLAKNKEMEVLNKNIIDRELEMVKIKEQIEQQKK